ncbi:P-loop containing nucleoside triphosphate hydrolase protein [Tribonema minus]|uniref:P-loop containing nucleoside triphosphate hydrolase protein n=1 Tax=Tribonema minus TaxID=303371 RepID=A0A835ZJB2_9STRA|nr:P-loop containing nucleoside triphosphate hydrolase protein [Tribonema minus]
MSRLIPQEEGIAVTIDNLTFKYDQAPSPTLKGFNLSLPKGSRCLLIGQNGAGKSTLLRVVGGRHLAKPDNAVVVLGRHAFRDTKLNMVRSYLDMDWGMRTVSFAGYGVPLQADIAVKNMMAKMQAENPERRDELTELLGVDPEWRMHQVSDGQRRRVQLLLGLVRPFDILLLDEITTSLDVVVRQDLLQWLRRESEVRGATIIYATHIFDGLDDWPSHLTYLTANGATGWQGRIEDLQLYRTLRAEGKPALLNVACTWLRDELNAQRAAKHKEAASGESVHENALKPFESGGGFAPGRLVSQLDG